MLLLFGAFIILLLLGVPIGFTLMLSSFVYIVVHDINMAIIIQKLAGGVNNFTLLAVPFFILAANFMNVSGITKRLFGFAKKCIGFAPGGLAHTNVLVSIIFSGMSGAAVADAGGLGIIELKAMREDNYDDYFIAAVTGASSIIGPIIPPSIPLVVYSVLTGTSVAALFAAGFIPGLIMGLSMMIIIYYLAIKRSYPRHPVPSIMEFIKALLSAIPTLITPIIILGGILGGIATPTEAGALAVIYALFLGAFAYKTLDWNLIKDAFVETAYSTASVMSIVVGSTLFAWVITIEQIPVLLSGHVLSIVGGSDILFLLICNVIFLIIGCFLEPTAAMLILMPILIPICNQLNISLVHFGIVVVLNLMIGLLTPPVGLVISMMSDLVKKPIERIFKATLPFFFVLIIVLLLLTFVPEISLFLPRLLNYI